MRRCDTTGLRRQPAPLGKERFGVINKQVNDIREAVADIRDGAIVLVPGFGAVGIADHLLEALCDQGARDLTIVANNAGNDEHGLARLINLGRVRKVICSYPRSGDYSAFLNAYRSKSLELELVPQGTISERMRCAAAGLGGFFSPVSAGTKLAEGKETRVIDGRLHVFEKPLRGDVALVKAADGDRWGNLTYRKSSRNFNPVCAMAADLTIVEVERMVDLGSLDPEAVVTPGIFVDRVIEVGRLPPRNHPLYAKYSGAAA
ncbi:3-oxoacid CoA-transferase subunit A [Bradyrhizobium sp. U87765 SZCCT0131]|nr:3-oxoacid CoA-transferase subunit A [Bradyrhizobium sp. U87765 SZCCT0131]MBR1264920.1 3-oxoacid CoA-transferase subunit A [Bradyrhizobium sp. U87765 SZCCT0134]MBR1304902.1 3-oxoacid CoA-transferase subunit A [Bradyrhizobium sp. U87765 SZCCT0110]MBR1320688.1 3-oxoacid CoA-transferase subunit A [Bradyrhizobium sp. U87765 SZCCT0109]MBR1349108.1 3-oxoacid CoA-transferase subunit A [Bradyrhizobium sp. U87765 SZCCT0048]